MTFSFSKRVCRLFNEMDIFGKLAIIQTTSRGNVLMSDLTAISVMSLVVHCFLKWRCSVDLVASASAGFLTVSILTRFTPKT